jgi:biopolymer transport protein ExbB
MIDLIQKGGPLMWLLLGASILMVAVIAERLTYLRRSAISVSDFLRGLSNLIRRGSYAEAQIECKSTPGPVARVVYAAILRPDLPRADLKEIVQEAGQLEVPRLETHLPLLSTIANVAPLVGLLGTVSGMIDSFVTISARSGYVTADAVSIGIYKSLLTTAAGLVVAIPAYVAHNYLSSKVNALLHDMERAGIEIVNVLTDHRNTPGIIPFGPGGNEVAPAAQVVEFRKQRRE